MLEARNLTKYDGAIPAVRDVSLTLRPGAILGLLGPNGSGKSTTVSILTGLLEPSGGRVYYNGIMPVSTHSSTRRILATYLTRRTRTPYLAGPEYVAFTLMRHSSARGGWPRTGRPARCAGASPVTVVWRRGRVGLFADRTRRGRPLSLHWQWAYGPAVRLVVGRPYEPPVSNTAPR